MVFGAKTPADPDKGGRQVRPSTWLADRFEDLVHIEVNTIESTNITGRAMPGPVQAIEEIASSFERYLVAAPGRDPVDSEGMAPRFDAADAGVRDMPADRLTLAEAQASLRHAIDIGAPRATPAHMVRIVEAALAEIRAVERDRRGQDPRTTILYRIFRNAQALFGVLAPGKADTVAAWRADTLVDWRAAAPAERHVMMEAELTPGGAEAVKADLLRRLSKEQRMQIRKIWEIKTDRIQFQTVLQLDGDVVTRLSAAKPRRPELAKEMHERGVRLSFDYWKTVLTLLETLLTGRK
ncbi:hypothetical protein ACQ5SO_14395 [Rhodovulum sp. DZ06]|uniref:hypothetical protein n=1 Tax=Rhodovulum sp. DZ06 TaxID=3425126 RepID=UPI003D329F7F